LTFRLDGSTVRANDARGGVATKRGSGMKRLLMVAVSAAILVAATASGALAGEVKGPPGTPCGGDTGVACVHNTNTTGALDHANSACAASGLNDMDPNDPGQTSSQVQTAADSWKYYGLPKGSPGTLGLCKGGTGER
jgi:hypothetical protein